MQRKSLPFLFLSVLSLTPTSLFAEIDKDKKLTFDVYYGNPYALAPHYYYFSPRYSPHHHYPYHYNHPHRRQYWHHPYANYEFRYDW